MEIAFNTEWLPEVFAACTCCVRESLDAAGLSLECAAAVDERSDDAWRMD